MSGATDVLALQATTRDYMRSQQWHVFLANVAIDCARSAGPVWCGDIAAQADRETDRLSAAEAFHVHSEAMPLVLWAAQQLPEDATWGLPMAPAAKGFLVFSETFDISALGVDAGFFNDIKAISWEVAPSPIGRSGVHLTAYGSTESTAAEEARTFQALADIQAEAKANGRDISDTPEVRAAHEALRGFKGLRQYGPLYGLGIDHVAWGEELAPELPDRQPRGLHRSLDIILDNPLETSDPEYNRKRFRAVRQALRRVLHATWTLLGQTIVVPEQEALTPGQQRAWAKRRVPPRVTVIRMRRAVGAERQEGESLVEWSHRWVVKGHWRRQPHGPGRTQTHLTWIAPYVKGPADKPLHVSQKVYSLVQ